MDPITYKRGEMRSFISTRQFALGMTGASVPAGGELAFDGSTVEFGGDNYSFPQLRGAIKAGWVVPAENYEEGNPEYNRRVSANIQVRHATQGGNPMQPQQRTSITTTESDERVVGNAVSHAAQTKTANGSFQRGTTRVNVAEEQDGVAVRSLKTLAGEKSKQARTVLTAESVGSALRSANASGVIDPGQGITEEEMLERMPEEDREQYLAEKESRKSKYEDDIKRAPVPSAPRKVGQVKTARSSEAEGMRFKTDVGNGIEIADMGGTGGKAKEATIVEDGITFRMTNGPDRSLKTQPHPRSEEALAAKTAAVSGTSDVRRKIAKSLCPDFPDLYDFNVPTKKKLARLQADFDDRPDVIQAVFAAESDDFKQILVEEFPQAFAG